LDGAGEQEGVDNQALGDLLTAVAAACYDATPPRSPAPTVLGPTHPLDLSHSQHRLTSARSPWPADKIDLSGDRYPEHMQSWINR
jgi:hypothetical protein